MKSIMTVEFRPENPSAAKKAFADGSKINNVSFFVDVLPVGTPTSPPFDTVLVRSRQTILTNVEVFNHGIHLRRTPRRGVVNPPPENIQHTFYNSQFGEGLQVTIDDVNVGKLFPLP